MEVKRGSSLSIRRFWGKGFPSPLGRPDTQANVDRDQEAGEKCRLMLHQNAANGPECALVTTYQQSGAIREPPKS